MRESGTVWLVGAGPGDPDLLTLKALRAIEDADVVVYDRLVSDEILDMIPTGVAKINVGKQPQLHPVPQDEINELLVRLAGDGRQVVRLKGGDPFMFGRGSEEAAYLLDHDIGFEVAPGVTSATGCASSIGVPLTHRGVANSVRFVTGHCCAESELDLDWKGMADPATTLVLYMSKAHIPQIAVKLIANGLAPNTPAAAVCNGTRDDQAHVISTLGEVAGDVADADFDGPVLFIIGRVVELAEVLGSGDGRVDRIVRGEGLRHA